MRSSISKDRGPAGKSAQNLGKRGPSQRDPKSEKQTPSKNIEMVSTTRSKKSSSSSGCGNGSNKKKGEMVASKVSREMKLFPKSVQTPCTMAMFKKFYESATPVKSEEMENNTLKLVGPTRNTGELDFVSLLRNSLADTASFRKENVDRSRGLV